MKYSKREKEEILKYKKIVGKIIRPIKKSDKKIIERYANASINRAIYQKEFVFGVMKKFVGKKSLILDYGCGDGGNSILLYKCLNPLKVYGFDLSPDLVKVAKKNIMINGLQKKIKINQDNGISTRFEDEKFNIIFINAVLHHMNLKKAIKEISRIIKKKGVVIVQEPIADSEFLKLVRKLIPIKKDEIPYHRQLTTKELSFYFKKYFEDVTLNYFMIFSRLSQLIKNRFVSRSLYYFDYFLLKLFPFLKIYAAHVCVIAKNKK